MSGEQKRAGIFADTLFCTAMAVSAFTWAYFVYPDIWPVIRQTEMDLPMIYWAFLIMAVITAFGVTTLYRLVILWRGSGQKRKVEEQS